jgi:hypothetical protein
MAVIIEHEVYNLISDKKEFVCDVDQSFKDTIRALLDKQEYSKNLEASFLAVCQIYDYLVVKRDILAKPRFALLRDIVLAKINELARSDLLTLSQAAHLRHYTGLI